ncbi:hypothetical protein FD755_001672 [Muntiacus reevesi]|uniref:Uncharacterized protein n=1 Tax=Muntiacus reevesi TaxID=9886 RepID=A0A5J5N2J8_MUNRE|nr:hypothetical protein FD755_001672 [Muntiacus reevesi]
MPLDLKALGKEYVKGEFRRHKTFGTDKVQSVLWQQAKENRQNSTEKAYFGTILPEEKQELMQEATKPNSQFGITDSMKPKI